MDKLAILVVDDDALYRRYISQMAASTDLTAGVMTASSAEIAIERLRLTRYDIVISDVVMANIDGIALLEHVKQRYPDIGMIMVSSFGGIGQQVTMRALQLGALDYILKNDAANRTWFLDRLTLLFESYAAKKQLTVVSPQAAAPTGEAPSAKLAKPGYSKDFEAVDYVIIIASTGGPKAIDTVLAGLAPQLNCPVIIVQHIPAKFTEVMAAQLAVKYKIAIREAKPGEVLQNNRLYLAPGGQHLSVEAKQRLPQFVVTEKFAGAGEIAPSADRLLTSMAEALSGAKIVVAVLTGMGNDGVAGLKRLKATNDVVTLAQDEPSCVVYGMSRSVVEAGLADEIVALDKIAARINAICRVNR
ncbi:MAG: chemotaxis protein CheB [Bacillota bacterium]